MSTLYRDNAIIPQTPAANMSDKKGYLVTIDGDEATLSASATTVANGVVIEPNDTAAGYAAEKVSVAILGAVKGTVPMRCGGSITAGARVQQHTDGTILTDAGTSARVIVGVALQDGVAGENIEVAPLTPTVLA